MERETLTSTPSRHWRFSVKNYDELLPPGPLAEQMDPVIALAAMRHCMTLQKSEGHFLSAWHHVEYAMNRSIPELDDSMRRKYIGDASFLLASLTNFTSERKPSISPNLYAQAMTLNIFLPVFTKRALGKEITPKDCGDIYFSFGRLFYDLAQIDDVDTSYKPARFAEMLGFSLSARSLQPELLLYSASPREEASPNQDSNHDGYFIRRNNKLPVQAKLEPTDKVYRAPTNVLCMEPIAKHALIRAELVDKDEVLPFGAATLLLSEYIIRETIDDDIDLYERRALDFATRSIAGRYRFLYPDLEIAS